MATNNIEHCEKFILDEFVLFWASESELEEWFYSIGWGYDVPEDWISSSIYRFEKLINVSEILSLRSTDKSVLLD